MKNKQFARIGKITPRALYKETSGVRNSVKNKASRSEDPAHPHIK